MPMYTASIGELPPRSAVTQDISTRPSQTGAAVLEQSIEDRSDRKAADPGRGGRELSN